MLLKIVREAHFISESDYKREEESLHLPCEQKKKNNLKKKCHLKKTDMCVKTIAKSINLESN